MVFSSIMQNARLKLKKKFDSNGELNKPLIL